MIFITRDERPPAGHGGAEENDMTARAYEDVEVRSRAGTMTAATMCFNAAVLMVVAGMIWGIVMAATQDHSAMPAHAHLNLLGFVSLFLFGIFYQLHPALDRSGLARLQAIVWIAATVVMIVGVGLLHSGREIGEPMAALSSLVVLADMLLFAFFVARRSRWLTA